MSSAVSGDEQRTGRGWAARGPPHPVPVSPPWAGSDEKVRVRVAANEGAHTLIQGCQPQQVSLPRDRVSWAVSCPAFGWVSPKQGHAAAAPPAFWCLGPTETPRLWVRGRAGLEVLPGVPNPSPCPRRAGCWWNGHREDAPTTPS